MDPRLQDAAMNGDIEGLDKLLQEHPFLLNMILPPFSENPLHIAAFTGQTEFAKRVVHQRPELVTERAGQGGLTPLHIAAGAGHAEFVNMLLVELDEELAIALTLIGDDQNNTPLHYAAAKGKVDVVKCLVEMNKQVIWRANSKGETPLHFAIRNRQVEALKEMVKCLDDVHAPNDIMEGQDHGGNGLSVLQLATSTGQNEIMELVNGQGNRRSDRKKEGNTSERDPLLSSGDALRVVGSMIASVTFQVAANPPPSLWKDGMKFKFWVGDIFHCGFVSNQKNCAEARLAGVVLSSSVSFLTSICLMIFFYKRKIASYLLGASLVCLMLTHLFLNLAFSPSNVAAYFIIGILYTLPFLSLFYDLLVRRLILVKLKFAHNGRARNRQRARKEKQSVHGSN